MSCINTIIETCYSSNTKSTESSHLGNAHLILLLSDLNQQVLPIFLLVLAQDARVHDGQINGRSRQVHNVGH